MLKNAYLDAKIGVDTNENEPRKEGCVVAGGLTVPRRAVTRTPSGKDSWSGALPLPRPPATSARTADFKSFSKYKYEIPAQYQNTSTKYSQITKLILQDFSNLLKFSEMWCEGFSAKSDVFANFQIIFCMIFL